MDEGPLGDKVLRLARYLQYLMQLRIRAKKRRATTIFLVGLREKQQNSSSPYTVRTHTYEKPLDFFVYAIYLS